MEVESKCEETFCDAYLNHDHASIPIITGNSGHVCRFLLNAFSVCDHKMSFAALQVFLNF